MQEVRLIEIKKDIQADNERVAAAVRDRLKGTRTFLLNLMSSPGSGKTRVILRTIRELKARFRFGVIEADIDSKVDAELVAAEGIDAIQLRTGGFCHLDASMVTRGLDGLDLERLDLLIIENVGNLVCPAEFDTGAIRNVMILSVPEGDDKPLKYPLMFSVADVLLINKIDYDPARPGREAQSRHRDLRGLRKDGRGLQRLDDLAQSRGRELSYGGLPVRVSLRSSPPQRWSRALQRPEPGLRVARGA
jgi:hydrogenase nickel incorporation protein HypB